MNLNPDFVISKDDIHRDGIFPHMKQLMEMAQRVPEITKQSIDRGRTTPADSLWKEEGYHLWVALKSSKPHLIYSRLDVPIVYLDAKPIEEACLLRLIQILSSFIFKPETMMTRNTINLIDTAQEKNWAPFEERYRREWHASFKDDFERFLNATIDAYQSISQVFLYLRSGYALLKDGKPTTFEFDALKRLYADAYETLGRRMEIVLLIENIANSKPIDQGISAFENASKHLRADTRWGKPHSMNFDFFKMKNYMNSIIRNSIAHNSNSHQDDKIEFIDDYKGRVRSTTLSEMEFILLSAQLASYLASLFAFELVVQRQCISAFYLRGFASARSNTFP